MDSSHWLVKRIDAAGGSVSFYEYMDLVLNDPIYGAYGAGHLKIGKTGDFVTSPSLGKEFSSLLSIQIADWLNQLLIDLPYNQKLSLIEFGAGEGDLILDLLLELESSHSHLLENLEVIIIEKNNAMRSKQKNKLSLINKVKIKWLELEDLIRLKVNGIAIAHEVLDAFPVERITFSKKTLHRVGIKLINKGKEFELILCKLPLTDKIKNYIQEIESGLGVKIVPEGVCDGWTTELHVDIKPWIEKVSGLINDGYLLIIDYMLEISRYYSKGRHSGTLLGYKQQTATNDILSSPGLMDLTSHLCLESIELFACKNDFKYVGHVRQGQALIALGLAERFESIRKLVLHDLPQAFERREALLRLIDPRCLGDFRWIALERTSSESTMLTRKKKPRFLQIPK